METPTHLSVISKAARALGLFTEEIQGDDHKTLLLISTGSSDTDAYRFCVIDGSSFYPTTPRWFLNIANNKINSEYLMQKCNIPCLTSHIFVHTKYHTAKELWQDVRRQAQFPLLFKPAVGLKGRDIQLIAKGADLKKLALKYWHNQKSFLLQPIYRQTEYRILIVNKTIYAAHAKQLPTVCGDNKHTIEALLKNTKYPVDTVFLDLQLTERGYNLKTILAAGETLPYTITRKGDPDIFFGPDEVPLAMKNWAQSVIAKLNVNTIGIDVFVPEDYKDLAAYNIIEINSNPGFTYLANKYKKSDLVDQIAKDILMDYFNLAKS